MSLEVTRAGLVVRAPLCASRRSIDSFVESRRSWAEEKLSALREREMRAAAAPPLTADDVKALSKEAAEYFPRRAVHFAKLIGVEYSRITIRCQRTRWGSCSSKGSVSLNCLLMLAPREAADSVLVHELCHIKHPNHSDAFYREVRRAFPEYDRWNAWLKENGSVLLMRVKK